MEKGIRVGQIYEARENLRRQGIRACYFLQFGYPGEGWREIESDDPDGAGDARRTISEYRFRIRCPGPGFIGTY